jgi:Sap, sulfolipid-1-addressing protein
LAPVFALALAAAVYPQLLAVVVVILTRERPKALLWMCYLAAICVNVAASVAILAVFRSRGSVAGTSSSRLGPSAYLIVGGFGLMLATLAATRWGRGLFGGDRPLLRLRRRNERRGRDSRSRPRSRAERALREGSRPIAAVVGAILGIPGPFDLLALGHLARSGSTRVSMIAAIVAFNLIKFVLIEVPIVSYAIRPERTAAQVERFAAWMHANKLEVLAGVVGLISLVLIGKGIVALT